LGVVIEVDTAKLVMGPARKLGVVRSFVGILKIRPTKPSSRSDSDHRYVCLVAILNWNVGRLIDWDI
jgi:hypothetical protein